MKEYATTEAELYTETDDPEFGTQKNYHTPAPVPPSPGKTWVMIGSVVHEHRVLWFWMRSGPGAGPSKPNLVSLKGGKKL